MAKRRISDRVVQEGIACFIHEARVCAKCNLGYAAMTTILSCILAVGESLGSGGQRLTVPTLFHTFCKQMPTVDRGWLLPPLGRRSPVRLDDVVRWLTKVRNGLAHNLAMPTKVVLLPNAQSPQKDAEGTWKIVVPKLIDAAENTIARITAQSPELVWKVGPQDSPKPAKSGRKKVSRPGRDVAAVARGQEPGAAASGAEGTIGGLDWTPD